MGNSTIFSGLKVTLFGHASVMLEADGLRFYIDPFVLPKSVEAADAILYTHGHFDHCVPAPSITNQNTISIGHGCKLPGRVIEIGGRENVKGAVVEAVHAYNISKPFHPKGSGAGYLVQFKSVRTYHAGDTDFIPEMKDIRCDLALLPIGGTYTMNVNEAVAAVEAINPKVVVPIHYNYLDGTSASPEEFRKLVVERMAGKVDVRILLP